MPGPLQTPTSRDYAAIARDLAATGDRRTRMHAVVDMLWERLSGLGVSWVGFYTAAQGASEMILGPRRDKPACSPIGLHGACGRAWTSKKALVVTDVARLGAGYIACDPRDRSEVVIPLFDSDGSCWGVLDVDSHDTGAFTHEDAAGLARVVRVAGLSWRDAEGVEVI